MRAQEFITEDNTIRIGNIVVLIDEHAIEQVYMREINPKNVDVALRKLPSVEPELSNIDVNSKIWVKDPVTGISLGLKRISSNQLKFRFKTAVENRTYDSQTPEIVMSEQAEQLDELTFMGMSRCTKDCSGHRAGYEWSKQRGGAHAASWSPSFNKGAEIAAAGY